MECGAAMEMATCPFVSALLVCCCAGGAVRGWEPTPGGVEGDDEADAGVVGTRCDGILSPIPVESKDTHTLHVRSGA